MFSVYESDKKSNGKSILISPPHQYRYFTFVLVGMLTSLIISIYEMNYHTDVVNFFLGGGGGAYFKILLLEGRSLERGAYQRGGAH